MDALETLGEMSEGAVAFVPRSGEADFVKFTGGPDKVCTRWAPHPLPRNLWASATLAGPFLTHETCAKYKCGFERAGAGGRRAGDGAGRRLRKGGRHPARAHAHHRVRGPCTDTQTDRQTDRFNHEHARSDRDDFVEIVEANIKDGMTVTNTCETNLKAVIEALWPTLPSTQRSSRSQEANAMSEDLTIRQTPQTRLLSSTQICSYISIMHYPLDAFSSNGKDTIQVLEPS